MTDEICSDGFVEESQVDDWNEKGMDQKSLRFQCVHKNFLELFKPISFSQGIRWLIKNYTLAHFQVWQQMKIVRLAINNLAYFESVSAFIIEAFTNPGDVSGIIAFSDARLSCHSNIAEQFMMYSISESTAEKGRHSSFSTN
jgi:hypothetical protein